MEQERDRNGNGYTTIITTMILEIQTKAMNIQDPYWGEQQYIHIHAGEEQVARLARKVLFLVSTTWIKSIWLFFP